MSGLNVLISGAGIGGPTAAYWLAKAGAQVTVVERASALRTSGQNVDIRGHGLRVTQRMGLEEQLRSKTTKEKGLRFVDRNNACRAEFPVDDGKGFTSDIEIMRGDLARIFYEATKGTVEYIFGETIKNTKDRDERLHVEFANGTPARDVDILIAADGWASTTRSLGFGYARMDAIKSLGQWTAWFTIPWRETDKDWARWYNATHGRMILIRPDNADATRVSLWIMSSQDKMEAVLRAGVDAQKDLFRQLFADAGWEAGRVLQGMEKADDFYMQQVAQVKMKKWWSGRTVLVGDAGYCPSPISGMGTTVAIVGAYVLAGEIARNPKDHKAAFEAYEEKMRPFVATAQKLAPGAPAMANPQTQWGISILHRFLGFVSWTRLNKLMGSSVNPPASAMDLPEYEM